MASSASSASGGERSPSPVKAPRRIVVTHRLPLRAEPNPDAPHGFDFSLDADALPLQLSRGLLRPVVFVGALPSAAASIPESDELAADLLARFSCSPVFLEAGLHRDFYDGFCKHYLWPMLHYLLPLTPYSISVGGGLNFDTRLYRAYLAANTKYADRVCELLDPEEDLVFIHDYHLWALPTLLRHKSTRARIGFFLHSPFPSSEIIRTIPVREELLRALLNADLVGFHTYDYARHFLSACCRLLGVNNRSRRGYIGLDYFGRTVVVKILPAGVDMEQLREVLSSPETAAKAEEIATRFAGRKVLLGVDDVDLFKGIGLKLVAMEKLLESRKELRGELVLVQINNPARSSGRDIDTVREEVQVMRDRINARFSSPGYEPIVTIDDPLTMHEKLAFYTSADICIVTAVRDGLSRIPYIYTVCRQEGPIAGDVADGAPRESAIVLSEFVGCSPSLSGAVPINPWNAEGVADGMSTALMLNELERQMRQEKHYSYVSKHDIVYWGQSLDQDLQRASKDNASMNMLNMGLAMNFRIIVLAPNFKKLLPGDINPSYNQTGNRLILLDYDGTVTPEEVMIRNPSQELIGVLNNLCSDPNNTVFVVSGRSKDELAGWLAPCERLGISAEHGYFTRWSKDSPWESANLAVNFDWKNIAEPIMKHYTDATDGSYIETKETALVWHYEEADPDFGSCQAKELQDHLLSVLSKEPVAVKSGHKIVEVNLKDVGKGTAVRSLIAAMGARGNLPDFILCVGDDGSDEDMFAAITTPSSNYAFPEAAEIFACTLGKKPSLAKYYLEDTDDVLKMLKSLTASSPLGGALQGQVSFEDT